MTLRSYFDAFDPRQLRRDYPLGEAFLTRFVGMSRGELRALQEQRFQSVLAFAWKVPFYQRLWGNAGIEPGDIGGLDDIVKLPAYSKSDLMESVERFPPIGDFDGLSTYGNDARPPLIFQSTSGTTGKPQPLLFGPKSREVQSIVLARLYALQGLTADDVVHSVYGHGMVNGGHYVRETITHWVGAQMLTAGTGLETRSANQIALMRDFRATAIIGFGDYIKRLADVAREAGLEPGRDLPIRMITGHLGAESHQSMSEAWGGAAVYDWYGVGDTGAIAGEAADRAGMYVQEDAQFVELLDVDDRTPVADGTVGDIVCTCLFKDDVFPIIRFNTHDVSRAHAGANDLRLPFRRIAGFLGRSDNMVKLRGVNVYPQGIGALLAGRHPEVLGEFYCRVERAAGRDEMTAVVETATASPALADLMAATLRERLGVAIAVELVGPGETAAVTGIEARQKPIRLVDDREST